MMRLSAVAAVLALALAGCVLGGGEAAGTLRLAIVDNAPDIEIHLAGAWAQQAGGTWHAFAGNTTLHLDGDGEEAASAEVPRGAYDRVRILFAAIRMDGAPLVLAEDGVELPLPAGFTVGDEAEVRLEFDWEEAVYSSAEGPTFLPVLAGLRLSQDGETTVDLERAQLSGTGTDPPVARIRAFDDTGLQVFESDFVADSPEERVLGTSGNVTFAASDSEAIEPGAGLVAFAWDFGDGTTGEGATVVHGYDLEGGNFTVRLTVTDSAGATDSQVLRIALLPAQVETTFPFTGRVTGINGNPQEGGEHTFDVDPAVAPDGTPAAGITFVRALLMPEGALLPGTDLDLRVTDGADRQVGAAATSSGTESFETEVAPDSQPAGGTWTALARPDPAVDAPYRIDVTVRWQLAGDPQFMDWARTYDDGHQHKH